MLDKEIVAYQEDPFISMIHALAANPEVSVDKLRQIMEMQEHIIDRNAEHAFNAAMVRAQAKMPIVPRDAYNSQTQSKYSKYETILKLCKPIYTTEGFSVLFHEGDPKKSEDVRVIAEVMHEEGHTKTVWADIPFDNVGMKGSVNKTNTHAKGSSFQYGRSYLMKQIFNIPSGNDDDGNAGGSDFITDEQSQELHALITDNFEKHKEYLTDVLAYFKIETFDDLPAKDYNRAKVAIQAAINKRKK